MLDAEQQPVTYDRYIDAVHTLAQALNKRAQELKTERDPRVFESKGTDYMAATDAASLREDTSDFKTMTFDQRADMVEMASVRHMLALAEKVKSNEGDALLEPYAVLVAQGQRSIDALTERLEHAFTEQKEQLALQREMVKNAWEQAGEKGMSEAIVNLAKLKMESLGITTPPELVLWHDVDLNVTNDESHNEGTPGLRQAKLVYQKHGRPGNELPVFAMIYGEMQNQPGVAGSWGRQLFRDIGVKASTSNLLPNVAETFQYAEQHGVDMKILTRNIRLVGEGLGLFLGVPQEDAFGRTTTDHTTTDKPRVILDAVASHPHTIHLLVDDGDSTILDNIKKGFPDGTNISEYAFLMGRSRTESTGKEYELTKLMTEHGLPHGLHGDNYEAVLETLQRYQAFCEEVQGKK